MDAQLLPALARWLSARGHEAAHVADLGLATTQDRVSWGHARSMGATIVSKDEDFLTLSALDPDGPALVWVRPGNTGRGHLLRVFDQLLPGIEQSLSAWDKVVEVT